MKNPKVIAAGMVTAAALLTAAAVGAGIYWTSDTHTTGSPVATSAPETSSAPIAKAASTSAAPPTTGSRSWSGNGTYSVGSAPTGGAKASIPPGRYTVSLMEGQTSGTWMRCSALPCLIGSPEAHPIEIGNASGPGFSTAVDVLPTDGAVYLQGVEFTAVN